MSFWMSAAGNGRCESAAAQLADIPIIMVTAKGADDYLVKPFGIMEMMVNPRRCHPVAPAKRLTAGGLTVDLEERTVMQMERNWVAPHEKTEGS